MKRTLILGLGATLALSMAACAVQGASEVYAGAEVHRLPNAGGSEVYRVRDREAGAVCYVSDGYNSGGIACVPSQ